jgi:hypothetical protein
MPTKSARPALRFASDGPVLVDVAAWTAGMERGESGLHFSRRLAVAGFSLAVVAGVEANALVVASGSRLRALRLSDFDEIATWELPFAPVQLAVAPFDPSVLAVASLQRVFVVALTERGFEVSHEIQLMLDILGQHIFVNSVAWLPNSLNLAVVCNAFVKVYDFSVDVLSPWACYTPEDGDFFTSAVFAPRGDDAAILLGTASGRVALQVVGPAGSDGPVYVAQYLQIPGIPGLPVISAAEGSGLLFLTAAGVDMVVCKLEEAIAGDGEIQFATIKLTDQIPWICIHNQGALHFFLNPVSSAVLTVEITDAEFEVAVLNKLDPDYHYREFRPPSFYLSYYVIGEDIFMISAQSGRKMALTHGAEDSDDEDDEDVNDVFTVPATFWSLSRIATGPILVSGTYADGDGANLINHHSRVRFRADGRKELRFKSSDPNVVIVGFKVSIDGSSANARPKWLKLNDRKTIVKAARPYMLALKPNEVQSGEITLELGSNGSSDIQCDGVDVFTVSQCSLPRRADSQGDWMIDATSVFDYADGKPHKISGPLGAIENLCSLTLTANGEELNDDTVIALVRLMYEAPDTSIFCRRMLVKGIGDRAKGLQLWATEMKRLVVAKAIHGQSWKLFWRDLALLPDELRSQIIGDVWMAGPEFPSPAAILCAFISG